jgi:hypothetical protein
MATFSFPFAPQPDCMLLEMLPLAVREKIIRLAVIDWEDSAISPKIYTSWDDGSSRSSGRIEIEHPLLKTCKQLRQESAKIFFVINIFSLNLDLYAAESHIPWHIQVDSNEMAVSTLARAFGRYAPYVTWLVVSFRIEIAPGLGVRVEIDIESSQDAPAPGVLVEAEGVEAHAALCRCRISKFAANHASERVLEFAQNYVRWMHTVVVEPRMVDCWNCGLKRMAKPYGRVCTREFVHDGSGDRAAPSSSLLRTLA